MKLSCPLGTARRVPREKFLRKPNNKPFIDQVFLVKMAGYWPRSFFICEFMDPRVWTETKSTSINTQKELALGQYPAILTSRLVITHMYLLPLAWNFQCSRTITFAYTGPSDDVAKPAQLSMWLPRRHGPCRSVQAAQTLLTCDHR